MILFLDREIAFEVLVQDDNAPHIYDGALSAATLLTDTDTTGEPWSPQPGTIAAAPSVSASAQRDIPCRP